MILYFGGKSTVASMVWQHFGTVRNYVEPFAGSLAVLLARPQPFTGTETVNDIDGLISNFWRATQHDAETVAEYADWPVNENDLHARHAWLIGQKDSLQTKLEGDPDFYDAKIAGWWVWGMSCWIGSGFCAADGPWQVQEVDGVKKLVNTNDQKGVRRNIPIIGNSGVGVNRKRVHLSDAGQGVNRKRPCLMRPHGTHGEGVRRARIDTGSGKGVTTLDHNGLLEYFVALCQRTRGVRVCCGDWSRVCGPTPTVTQGRTAVFIDPPYPDEAKRSGRLYRCESGTVAHDCFKWALEFENDPRMRIAFCGYEGSHSFPKSWRCVEWKASGGYGNQGETDGKANAHRERIWFSPHCVFRKVERFFS